MTRYLSLDDALHVTHRFGFHLRDAGMLASALARPGTRVMGKDAYPTLAMKCAVSLESVTRNHPLLDGNKRTGVTLMLMFLRFNGVTLEASETDLFNLVVGVASGAIQANDSASTIGSMIRRS